VTNTEEEMTDPKEPFAYNDRMVNLGPQYQVLFHGSEKLLRRAGRE